MKLSPLSIPYRVAERGGSVAFTAAILFSGTRQVVGPTGSILGGALVGLLLIALVGYEVARFRRFEYELAGDTLDLRSGVFSRRNREIPVRRVQNVDISRNVVQRALGIAAVDFETAGGSQTEASLRFVAFEEAKHLQRTIGRLKRGAGPEATGGDADPDGDGDVLFALSPRELALVGAFSFDPRVPGLLIVLVSGGVPVVSPYLPTGGGRTVLAAGAVALVAGLVLVAWVAGAASTVLNYYGFRLRRVGDELQYERGLLRRYDGTIPLDKVQTLTVVDDPLKRRFGYASLRIETAGYAPGTGAGGGSEAAVPLATRDRVFDLAGRIEAFGTPAFERPPRRVRRRYAVRYLLGVGAATAALYALDSVTGGVLPWYLPLVALPVIPVAAHLKWRHRGRWLGADHFVTRNGVLRRRIRIVPHYRIQTVIDTRTVFQRRWGVATVTADTAGSSALIGGDASAVDVDAGSADRLRAALPDRLRAALAARRGWTEDRIEGRDGTDRIQPEDGSDTRGGDPG
jgi:putative membrane protein